MIFLMVSFLWYFKLSLYFTDRYLWYVYIGEKHYEVSNAITNVEDSESLKYADKAIQLNPDRLEAYRLKVRTFIELKLFSKAEEELYLSKEMNDSGFYYSYMGRIMQEKGMLDDPIDYFSKGIKEYPFFAGNYINLGLDYLRIGDTENAFKYLNRSQSLVEQLSSKEFLKKRRLGLIHAGLGLIYREQGLDEKAEEEFKIAKKYYKNAVDRFLIQFLN